MSLADTIERKFLEFCENYVFPLSNEEYSIAYNDKVFYIHRINSGEIIASRSVFEFNKEASNDDRMTHECVIKWFHETTDNDKEFLNTINLSKEELDRLNQNKLHEKLICFFM